MIDFLSEMYPWTKSLHIIAVITWMAGIFYLPRLYVYHTEEAKYDPEVDLLFQVMERRLLRAIMNPSMIAVWIFGIALIYTPGIVDWTMIWPWTKGAAVLLMTWFHHWLAQRRKDLALGKSTLTGRQYRLMNEFPTILLLVIVFSVVVKF